MLRCCISDCDAWGLADRVIGASVYVQMCGPFGLSTEARLLDRARRLIIVLVHCVIRFFCFNSQLIFIVVSVLFVVLIHYFRDFAELFLQWQFLPSFALIMECIVAQSWVWLVLIMVLLLVQVLSLHLSSLIKVFHLLLRPVLLSVKNLVHLILVWILLVRFRALTHGICVRTLHLDR